MSTYEELYGDATEAKKWRVLRLTVGQSHSRIGDRFGTWTRELAIDPAEGIRATIRRFEESRGVVVLVAQDIGSLYTVNAGNRHVG